MTLGAFLVFAPGAVRVDDEDATAFAAVGGVHDEYLAVLDICMIGR